MSEVIEGQARFEATAKAAARALTDLSAVHQLAVDELQAEALPRTPRRTGELAGSFGARITDTIGELVNTARHAGFVNFGTRFMIGRRFMPADPATTITPIYLQEVDEIVDTIKGM